MLKSVAITSLNAKGGDGQGVKVGDIAEPARRAVPVGNRQVPKVTAAPAWQAPADNQESLLFHHQFFY